jgi:hypothetical protein
LRERGAGELQVRFCGPGQAEVQHLDAPVVGHHHVDGLQVAMRDVLAMRCRQRVGQGDRDIEELLQRDASPGDQLIEGASLEQFHDQIDGAALLADVVDGADMRMI